MSEFLEYLAMQDGEEKSEAKLLQMEQDELAAQEQQLLNANEELDEDDDEKMRQNLSELLEVNMPRQESVSPSEDAAPPDLMNEQLRAELDRVQKLREKERKQWQTDNLGWREALNEANQQLVEEETALQGEVRE